MNYTDTVNWLNDLTWGPWEYLRPAKTAKIGAKLMLSVCTVGIVSIGVGAFAGIAALEACSYYLHNHHWPTPLRSAVMFEPLFTQGWWLLIFAAVIFPVLMVPFAICWNRRAELLRQLSQRHMGGVEGTVWPPPPMNAETPPPV